MGFWPFGKKAKQSDPIGDFWKWWAESADSVADALESRTVQDWVEPITAHVRAIDPALAWELGPGVRSAHHFCLTSEGNRPLRVTCERWLAVAPSASARWEYYPARQAHPGPINGQALSIGNTQVDFDDFRLILDVDETRRLVHVRATHPSFESLSQELVKAWKSQHAHRLIELELRHDPEWSTQQRW